VTKLNCASALTLINRATVAKARTRIRLRHKSAI